MTGENIICFAKDWCEDPTSNNHVMRQLARANRVLWLNSLATRAPSLSSRRDLGKIARKLAAFLSGPRQVDDRLWVYTPLVLPLPHSRVAAAVNRWILAVTLRLLRRRLRMREFQLWTFLPNVADYLGRLGESLCVYYCVDEWAGFTYLDGPRTAAAEERLCRRADVVFAVSERLVDRRRSLNPETHLATHGVDHAAFSRALDDATELPADVAGLPRPILGFYGTIQDWIDLDLIAYLAARHPDWSIVMLGRVFVDVSSAAACPNVHFLGRRDHDRLPAYCKAFSVGIIPYRINDRLLAVNPLKLREYLSAGLPVVSTAVPEVARWDHLCTVAPDHAAFEEGVLRALETDTPERRRRRSEAMRAETWDRKVAEVARQVLRVKENRCPSR